MASRPAQPASVPPSGAEEEDARIPRPGEIVAQRYRIDGYLGRGGMGAVLAATHVVTGKRCAIKWVLPRARSSEDGGDARRTAKERLLREARMAGRIDHPNVVHVQDVGEHRSSIFLVMELLEGEPLKAAIARGPMPYADAIRLMLPILRGVAAAHAVGIVHRDLKPDNVILARGEENGALRPTVLDFGISRGAEDGLPGDLTLTQTGVMVGTPLYMAPEQLAGATEVDPRYDVYALGVILYELVTGSRPFDEETYALLVSAKLNGQPAPPSRWLEDLDPRLEKALLKAMARKPSARFGSVQQFAAALEPFSEGATFHDADPYWRPSAARPLDAATMRQPRPPRGFPWVAALAAAVALGLLAGAWWTSQPPAPAEPAPAAVLPPLTLGAPDAGTSSAADEPAEEDDEGRRRVRRGGGARGRTGRLRVEDF